MRGADPEKDQSYFLHMLDSEVLGRLLFPLGELSKVQVRQQAAILDLPGANKGESQELCFIPRGRYDSFVAERASERLRPGPIVDDEGRQVGNHSGVHGFTVGQRRNLGVALGKRSYVVQIDSDTATVRLGPKQALRSLGARLSQVALQSGVKAPLECDVAVRYRGRPTPGTVEGDSESGYHVRFREPVSAVVKGQFAVFYANERVLGGGMIDGPLEGNLADA
jgi:tRNA-specific 2-thiouridylase